MRNLILFSALLLASASQTAVGAVEGQWTYIVENGGATITASSATGDVTIPSLLGGYAVKRVGQQDSSIFGNYNTSVTSVTIPNSVTSIGNSAFKYCESLTSITIPNSVTSIGDEAFKYCSSLTSITIPNSVTSIGGTAFYGCSYLTSITIPNSVTRIEYATFVGCYGLSITIPNSVTSIGDYAFYASGLTSIIIPNSVTSIGNWAFANCHTLSSVYFLGNAPTFEDDPFHESTPTVYYFSGSTGWGGIYAGRPTALSVRFNLSVICDSTKGTVTETPDLGLYILGTQIILTVTPKAGYLLTAWSGNSTASTTSITLTMDSDKSVTANFAQDSGDNDGDGLTNYQESITYGTNPDSKDSNNDNIEDGQAVALGYSPTFNFSSLISHLQSHPPTGLYTATQMQSMAIGDLVLTKNANGSFTLNYDIEQSTDLQNWTPYQAYALPLTGLPTGKAFVRIRVK